jgi:hypothetical protein
LVRSQFAGETVGGGSGLEPAVLGTGEEITEPPVGLHLDNG